MFLIAGERIRRERESQGEFECPSCGDRASFARVRESNWFTFFGLPIARIETLANFDECENCGTAYLPGQIDFPSELSLVKQTLAYMLVGYGMAHHAELALSACFKLTGFQFPQAEFVAEVNACEGETVDLRQAAAAASAGMNSRGKERVVAAAFLMTYACCELEHEDRVRINLLGNAMGVTLTQVEAIVASLRARNYLGIRRYLPTMNTP